MIVVVFLFIVLFFESMTLLEIYNNEYLDKYYFYVYLVLVIAIAAAAFMYLWYCLAKDSPGTRSLLPWALLIAVIANLFIIIWVCIYILGLYPHEKVYVQRYDKHSDEYDEDTGMHKKKYVKESKGSYILIHILSPVVYGLSFLVFYFFVKEWVRMHQN